MMLVRLTVYGCILVSLWFNGSYAWSKGGALHHQLAMVALALALDLAKCSFLVGASHLWHRDWRLPAIVLMILWVPCLAYSGFTAFASISVNRTEGTADARQNATAYAIRKASYDRLTSALDQAKSSPYWRSTRACTSARTGTHRRFCRNVDQIAADLKAASTAFLAAKPTTAEPELDLLQRTLGWSATTLALIVALVPALIIELIASLGLYAVHRPADRQRNQTPSEGLLRPKPEPIAETPRKLLEGADRPSPGTSEPTPGRISWQASR